ncbi:MAG: ATP synthase subunit I [Terriglobales bacterium]
MTTEAEAFYAGAERRIPRFMAAVFLLSAGSFWYWRGTEFVLAFLLGAVVAFVNLVWLKQITAAYVDRLSGSGARGSSGGLVLRFLLRYTLIALLAYGMFNNHLAGVHGFFAGLFLPVAAFTCEAVYELYAALRRGL